VLASWHRAIAYAYWPERLFARFRDPVDATYANRLRLPAKGKVTKINLKRGAVLAYNIGGESGSYPITERLSGARLGTPYAAAKSRQSLAWASLCGI
jgi:hypothetical protein